MRKGGKCIAQTINLSNPETCIRPKRIQKLVAADVMQPCPGTGSSAFWTPRTVAIKVCSWKDMKRTCPPKLCECPQKPKAKTAGQRLCRALMFLLKSGIAAGLVYWTHSEGLWGSSADVEDLYYRIVATIAPALPDSGGDDIELPRFGHLKYRMIEKYNHAVYGATNCILSASASLQRQLHDFLHPPLEETIEEESSEDLSEPRDNDPKSNGAIKGDGEGEGEGEP